MVHLLFLASLLIALSFSQPPGILECGSDKIGPPRFVFTSSEEDEWYREEEYKPIRLGIYYSAFDLGSEEENEYFKQRLMPIIKNFFTRVLQVKRLTMNLVVGTDMCNDAYIPHSHQTIGLSDIDLAIYITSDDLPEETYVAAAGACLLQALGLNNVLAGSVLVNSPLYHQLSEEEKVSLMTHEITHILGFTDGLFEYYHKPNGDLYTAEEIIGYEFVREDWRYIVKTPTVLAEAQRVFDCEDMNGLELENNGGSGSAGSHWEQRLAYHDYMAAQITADTLYTTFTFALLKDSGWYEIDWTYVQEPAFGAGEGCDFVFELCVNDDQEPLMEDFCSQIQDRCDMFHLQKGYCDVVVHDSPLNPPDQYFDNPFIGGKGSYRDYCPIIREYDEGSCRGLGVKETDINELYGEIVCENCRCFEGTLVREEVEKTETEFHTACYEVVECLDDRAIVRVGNDIFGYETVECLFGEDAEDVEVPGYTGYLTCPPSDILCGHVPCINNCSGRGICTNGECVCDTGFGGSSCEFECIESCATCSGPSPFDCLSCSGENTMLNYNGSCGCKTSYTEVEGHCVCLNGTQGEDGVCYEGCGDLCAECDFATEDCIDCVENAEKTGKKCYCSENYQEVDGECVGIQVSIFSFLGNN